MHVACAGFTKTSSQRHSFPTSLDSVPCTETPGNGPWIHHKVIMATAFCHRLEKQNGSEQLLALSDHSLNMKLLRTPGIHTHTQNREECVCVCVCSSRCVSTACYSESVHARVCTLCFCVSQGRIYFPWVALGLGWKTIVLSALAKSRCSLAWRVSLAPTPQLYWWFATIP